MEICFLCHHLISYFKNVGYIVSASGPWCRALYSLAVNIRIVSSSCSCIIYIVCYTFAVIFASDSYYLSMHKVSFVWELLGSPSSVGEIVQSSCILNESFFFQAN